MKQYRLQRVFLFFFVSGILFLTACQRESAGQPVGGQIVVPRSSSTETSSARLPLKPSFREGTIAALYVRLLESQHISQGKLDTKHSKEAFRLYIKSLDPLKMYFYQSDFDEFQNKFEAKFCDFARQKDVGPAFMIYNRFLDRIKERVDTIMQILDTPMDFTIDEEVIRDKDLMRWPTNPDDAYDRWRKRIKDDILAMKADSLFKEKERQEALAHGKEPPKIDARDPIERIRKRYDSFRKRMLLETHVADRSILDNIQRAANDEVMESYLTAISGALDPHTTYMSPSTLENFKISMGKSLEGIGATLSTEDGYTVVKRLVKGGPAEKSGEIKADDKIQGVGQGKDGEIEDVIDSRISDVVKLIRGAKGTLVRLEILPSDGGAIKIVEIVRDKVSMEDQLALSAIFEAGEKPNGAPFKIGVISVPDFYLDMDAARRGESNIRSTSADMRGYLKDFVAAKVDAVVVYLRMNPGGSLTEAIDATGLFIETGNVVQTKDDSSAMPQQRDDRDPGCEWTGPLVVVQGKFSASASEIFAGAIQDYKRGLVIGDSRSHGKGTVQQLKDMAEMLFNSSNVDLGAIKLTIQGFYRPSGISTQRDGIASDVLIPSLEDALDDICESDLDNALTFTKIPRAKNHPNLPYVTPSIIAEIQKMSTRRISDNEEFQKVQKEIANYRELKDRKTSTLNEKKYMEEYERMNADRRNQDKLEEMLENIGTIQRDYYMEEILAITVDYVKLLERQGINFPTARTVVKKPSPLSFLFGQ